MNKPRYPFEALYGSNPPRGERNGWSFPPTVRRLLKELSAGRRVLHLFGGAAKFGTRLDVDPITRPDVIGDAWLPPFADRTFDIVVIDPPYDRLDRQTHHDLLSAAARVARERVIWFHTLWIEPPKGMAIDRAWLLRIGDNCAVRALQVFTITDRARIPTPQFRRGPARKYRRWLGDQTPLPFPPANPSPVRAKVSQVLPATPCPRPWAVDLFCGSGGWTVGLQAAGFRVTGVDLQRHPDYPTLGKLQLVIGDATKISGEQFRGATLIVASPPCQEFSRWDQPWPNTKAHRGQPNLSLVAAARRIAREAGAPLILENVRGAQHFLGPAQAHYGPFYLWGDVPALLPAWRGENKKSMPRPDLAARIPTILSEHIARCFLPPGSPPPEKPACDHAIATVLETRTLEKGHQVRRRFQCAACPYRWTEYGTATRHQKLRGRSRYAH